jgi:hypothetical protein
MIPVMPDRKTFVRQNIRVGKGEPWFPLLPRHDIYLFAPNCGGEQFSSLFGETWKRLPLFARRRILRHWRIDDCPTLVSYFPHIPTAISLNFPSADHVSG